MFAALIPLLGTLLDKLLPDPKAAAEAKLELLRMAQAGELAQLEVNKAEAQSADPFTSRWRPLIGYICGLALAWDTIIKPMAITGYILWGHPAPALPDLGDNQLMSLLFGLLGLGGLRTIEKVKGVAT